MKNQVLADRLSSVNESATLALNARAKQLAQSGKKIYNLTAGELATDTPTDIRQEVAASLHKNKYTPVGGLAELRQAIADQARDFYGLDWIKPADVVVTAGAKPALYVSLLSLVNNGDEVIVPTPAWVSYISLIELAGGKAVEVPLTSEFDIDAKAIQAAITSKTKTIIINSPHNPTGATFSEKSLRELSAVLKGSGITVISDDIYSKLIYDENFCLVPTIDFEHLIIVNGFSKSQALTGWRIGYLIASEAVAKAATNLLSHTMGNASVPSQHAAVAALKRQDKPPADVMDELAHNRSLADSILSTIPDLKYKLPSGAFYIFLDLRAITADSLRWCEELLTATGVAVVPGEAFSAAGFARLSFVSDKVILEEGLNKLKDFIMKGEK